MQRNRAHTGLQTPEAIHVTWDPDGATNIGSPADERTFEVQKSSLTPGRATRCETRVTWMGGQSPEMIVRLTPLHLGSISYSSHRIHEKPRPQISPETHQNALRQVCFADDDSAKLFENLSKDAIRAGGFERTAHVTEG